MTEVKYPWLSTRAAAAHLGLSAATLAAMRKDGRLWLGKHYKRLGQGSRAPYRWNVEAIELSLVSVQWPGGL